MNGPLQVLLRTGNHGAAAGAVIRLALKVEQVTVAVQRNPIQVGLPNSEPIVFDLGINRPSLTISGLIDSVGGDTSNTTNTAQSVSGGQYYGGMERLSLTGPNETFSAWNVTRDYYIPYKNYLEGKLVTWSSISGLDIQVEIGDAQYPLWNTSGDGDVVTGETTGGAIYHCVIGSFQFSQSPGTEDRWAFSLQFPCKTRSDIAYYSS